MHLLDSLYDVIFFVLQNHSYSSLFPFFVRLLLSFLFFHFNSYSSYTAGQPSAYPSSYYPVPYNNYPSTQSSFTSIVNPPPKPTYQYTQPSQIGQQQIPSNLSQQGSNTATYQYTQSFAGPPPSSSHLPQQGTHTSRYHSSHSSYIYLPGPILTISSTHLLYCALHSPR